MPWLPRPEDRLLWEIGVGEIWMTLDSLVLCTSPCVSQRPTWLTLKKRSQPLIAAGCSDLPSTPRRSVVFHLGEWNNSGRVRPNTAFGVVKQHGVPQLLHTCSESGPKNRVAAASIEGETGPAHSSTNKPIVTPAPDSRWLNQWFLHLFLRPPRQSR